MPRKERVYGELRSLLKTGDLVLFSGQDKVSRIIRWRTKSDYSHVGMVLNSPDYHDDVTIWEATKPVGVRLTPLSEHVRNYEGSIVLRRLRNAQLSDEDMKEFKVLFEELSGRPFEQEIPQLIGAAFDLFPEQLTKEDLSSLFCSELVAEAYQALSLLDEYKPSNEYTPADFSDKGKLQLQRGHLGTEIRLKTA